jgi:hypothetical protein
VTPDEERDEAELIAELESLSEPELKRTIHALALSTGLDELGLCRQCGAAVLMDEPHDWNKHDKQQLSKGSE